MDKSIEYAEMCMNAPEISDLWKYSRRSSGDFYFHKKLNSVYAISNIDQDDKDCVWIPRFDQLIFIWKILYPTPTAWDTIRQFYDKTATDKKGLNAYYIHFSTIEQVAFCFIMREMH